MLHQDLGKNSVTDSDNHNNGMLLEKCGSIGLLDNHHRFRARMDVASNSSNSLAA